jgi:membrane-associated phospholipid phosphatase
MMNDLLQLQIGFTLWLQAISPALDPLFKAINLLQTEEFLLIVLPIVWWCVDKRIGASLIILFSSCDFFSRFLKGATGETRPYDLDRRIRNLDPQPDSSFPSAGELDTMIFWGYLALQFRRRALWVWAVAAIILVGVARIYLGAHYPTDVLASILIAVAILALVIRGRLLERVAASPRSAQWVMAIGWPLVLALLMLNSETAVSLGGMLGFNIGLMIETQSVHFDPRGKLWMQIVKLVVGLAVVIGLRLAIKPLLPLGPLSDMVRYAIIGLWLGAGAPCVFVLTRLAKRELPVASA